MLKKKTNKSKKHLCGQCFKNVPKTAKAISCAGTCKLWYHLRCTRITDVYYNEIKTSGITWTCDSCNGPNTTPSSIATNETTENSFSDDIQVTNEINKTLTGEIENLNKIISSLNEELQEACKEIKNIRQHNTSLESIVLKKEEELVKLEESYSVLEDKYNKLLNEPEMNKCNKLLARNYSTIVKFNKNKQHVSTSTPKIDYCTPNRYEALSTEEQDDHNSRSSARQQDRKELSNSNKRQRRKKRLLIVADSHGKHLAPLMEEEFGNDYQVEVVTNPGAPLEYITQNLVDMTSKFNKEDQAIVIGGSNDCDKVYNRNTVDSFRLEKIRCVTSKTNVHLVSIPLRYDKPFRNFDIHCTNTRVQKQVQNFDLASYIDISELGRDSFTTHGLHLNRLGKLNLVKYIKQAVNNNCSKEQTPPPHSFLSQK